MLNTGSMSINNAPETRISHVQGHASRLHDLASRLDKANTEIEHLIGRMFGPEPPQVTATDGKQPDPQGVLHVAAFGAERIHREIGRLEVLIGRLNEVA